MPASAVCGLKEKPDAFVQYVKPFSVSILGMLGAACARLIWLNPHNKKQKVTFRRNIALLLKTVL
nr:MAG TPA: hypothetical protein [Caudoviricetes sp.]